MSPTTWGWLVLLFPLIGTVSIGVGFKRWGRAAGVIGTTAIALSFVCAVGALISLLGKPEHGRELTSSLWNYAASSGVDGPPASGASTIGMSQRSRIMLPSCTSGADARGARWSR